VGKGKIDQALQQAPYTLRERFRHHRYCAAPLEGRGVVAWVEPKTNVLTIWSSTQMPHLVRRQIAAQLNLPEERVRVIAPDIGGGFGPKVFVYPEEILVAFLALELRRPVKWIEDRREHFISTAHGPDRRLQYRCSPSGPIQNTSFAGQRDLRLDEQGAECALSWRGAP
jgi:carbon-monoxide dehydrogenase large subunit